MSILTDNPIGIIKGDSFFGIEKLSNNSYRHHWCCDSFTIQHQFHVNPEGKTKDKVLTFNVTFMSATGEQTFEWDLSSFIRLKYHLYSTLLNHGVRCSPDPKATAAILNAIQNSYTKEQENVH